MSRSSSLLAATRQAILDIADNNKKRWSHFSGDGPLTFDRFAKKLVELKITRNPDDAATVWQAFNPAGSEMQFREFIQFLQNDKLQASPAAEKSSSDGGAMAKLYEQRREFIDYCLGIDKRVSGTITEKQLTLFAMENGVVSKPGELFVVVSQVCKQKSGEIPYFKLMHKLTQMGGDDFVLETSGPRQHLDEDIFGGGETKSAKKAGGRSHLDPSIFGESQPKSPAHESKARQGLDPSIFGERSGSTREPESRSGGRAQLDPSIFGEKSGSREAESRSGGRAQLDPSIFGEKHVEAGARAAPAAKIDLENAKDCTDYNADQTISLVARIANSKFKSIRDCFGSWRGGSDRLSWEDIYRGMVNDAKMEISPEIIESLVEEYGGDLTVSSFTRLVSDGARLNAPEPVREAPPPPSERDIMLDKIATALKGKTWEVTVKSSKNALDLSRNLKKFGIDLKSEKLRGTFEELGIRKIVEEIKQRQAPPKKRRGA